MNKRVIAGTAIAALLVVVGAVVFRMSATQNESVSTNTVTVTVPAAAPLTVPMVTVAPSLRTAITVSQDTVSPTADSSIDPMVSGQLSAMRPAHTKSGSAGSTAKPSVKASVKPVAKPAVKPTVKPVVGTKPTVTPKPTVDLFCTLEIFGSKVQVYNSVTDKSLEKRPGWLTSSARPGEDGVCVIYGHRNRRHLRVLENIEIGDEIAVIMADGSKYVYEVFDTQIYESTEELRLPVYDGRVLAVVTCYPFRYSGSAPGKFLCVGRIG